LDHLIRLPLTVIRRVTTADGFPAHAARSPHHVATLQMSRHVSGASMICDLHSATTDVCKEAPRVQHRSTLHQSFWSRRGYTKTLTVDARVLLYKTMVHAHRTHCTFTLLRTALLNAIGNVTTRSLNLSAASPARCLANSSCTQVIKIEGVFSGMMSYIFNEFLTVSAGGPSFSVGHVAHKLGTGLRGSHTLIPTPVLTQNYLMYRRSCTLQTR